MDMGNDLILYYYNLRIDRARQLSLRMVPVKFRQMVTLKCHIYLLVGDIHGQQNLFRIMEWFWWPIANNEVDQFIRAYTH